MQFNLISLYVFGSFGQMFSDLKYTLKRGDSNRLDEAHNSTYQIGIGGSQTLDSRAGVVDTIVFGSQAK